MAFKTVYTKVILWEDCQISEYLELFPVEDGARRGNLHFEQKHMKILLIQVILVCINQPLEPDISFSSGYMIKNI